MAKILIIEDSEMLHRMYSRKLREHELEIVVSGKRALEVLEKGQFDLVISDGDIEGPMHGMDVWEWVASNRQDLLSKYVFCSGNLELEKFCKLKGIEFFDKGDPISFFNHINTKLEAIRCCSPGTTCSCCSTTSAPSSSNAP